MNLTTTNAATVPVYLVSFQTGEGQFWAHLCAGATPACQPVLILPGRRRTSLPAA